jgi:lambda family phage portal protein
LNTSHIQVIDAFHERNGDPPPPFRARSGGRARADRLGSRPAARAVRARYDAAVTTDENFMHWANADGLSANAANSPEVRRILRNRARYESANNSWCRGIVLTLANASISTGPRLQVQTANDDANNRIEAAFGQWAQLIHLPEKLRTMRQSRAVDGEAFAMLATNPKIDHEITLDIKLIEADQVADPYPLAGLDTFRPASSHVDGIDFDSFGNPTTYYLLEEHPGDLAYRFAARALRVAARFVLHWFRQDRPGQARGIPDITPALPLFAQLRRYTLATIAAAETAADLAAVLETTEPPGLEDEAGDSETWDSIPIRPRLMARLPDGYKMSQFKPEQPASTYETTVRQIVNEIIRCLEMPLAVGLGNSSGYNYASGRLDFQVFGRAVAIERTDIESAILRRIFEAWLDEAATLPGYLPPGLPARNVPHAWYWPAERHVDPMKEAQAQAARLINLTTTYADEFAAEGQDWKTQFAQRAREQKEMIRLGLVSPTPPEQQPPPDDPEPDLDEDELDNDEADEEPAPEPAEELADDED